VTSRLRAAVVLGAIYVLGVIYGTFVLVLKPPPPAPVAQPAARPALSKHLLLVIVDGLRYDVAIDRAGMPNFAEAMRTRRGGDIYAGRISMTSAAIQNYGTGQRGRFAQIVRNINPDPPAYNSWLQNARARGLTLALAGEPGWSDMFGPSFQYTLLDPPGVAMDYDYNDVTFRSARALLQKSPHFLVAHFGTPDHQAHVYGIQSPRYRAHIYDFDRRLFELLGELGSDWTVIVTSDHGAADSGTHGADVPIQRRSPIFAYGPGIAATGPAESLDQSDLASTFAALLGVPAAAHSQGHVLSSWLDVSSEAQADFGCADAKRVLSLAQSQVPSRAEALAARLASVCEQRRPATERRRDAMVVAREIDEALTLAQGFSSWQAWMFGVATLFGAALVGWLLTGRSVAAAAWCALLGIVAIVLVARLEQLPGSWPKGIDATLFVIFNLPLLLFLLKPERLILLLDQQPALAAAVVPGGFAVAYPTNLQPIAFSLCLIAPLLIALGNRSEIWGISWRGGSGARRFIDPVLVVGFGLALAPAGITASGAYSTLVQHERLTLGLALTLLGCVAFVVVRGSPQVLRQFIWLSGLAVASLLLRRVAPAWLGRPLLVGLPLLAALLLWRHQLVLALGLGFIGYLWVSRDFEVLPVAGGLGIAVLLGERLSAISQEGWSRGRRLIVVGVLFCLMFLVRIGMSAGLDALSLDFGAGAFGDKHVSAAWITFAVIWKYVLVAVLLIVALLHGVPSEIATRILVNLSVIGVCRAAVLLGMMQCAQGSFWTAMRVMSDLPFALLFAVCAALALPWAATRKPAQVPAL